MDNALDLRKKDHTHFLFVQDGTGVPVLAGCEDIKSAPELTKWHMLWKACETKTFIVKTEIKSTKSKSCDAVMNNNGPQNRNALPRAKTPQLLTRANAKVAH